MTSEGRYWFPAKRFGWGWGLPVAWQGWVVMAVFFAALLAVAVALLPGRAPFPFLGYSILLCVLLVAVCWAKGEPPRARCGDE